MRRNRKSITIHDVAAAAGVSVSTVSRVLNDKDDVAAETYERVQEVIKELGYASSLAARGMRSRATNVIGLILPDVSSYYSVDVMRGVNRAIAQLHYDLIVYTGGVGSADRESYYVSLLNGSVTDGVIVVAPEATNFATNAPVVAVDPNHERPECPAIISTNHEGALQAMEYLTGLGHRRIGFITGRQELVSNERRQEGYRDGLAAAGLPFENDLIQVGDYTTATALECTRNLLDLAEPPTAIFAANDLSALGVYQVAEERGLRIPEDLSVIGFDNGIDSVLAKPGLTTIDQFVSEMGFIAVEMIVKMLKNEPLETNLHKIQTQLIVRESCRAVAS